MTYVIIVNGKPRAGKDTFVDMVTAIFRAGHVPVASFSSIDPVRHLLTDAGFDLSQKTEADRKLLAVVCGALEDHSNWRTKQCFSVIEEFHSSFSGPGIFFLHMREPKNIAALSSNITNPSIVVKTLIVENDRVPFITSNDADQGIFDMTYDYRITNHGSMQDLLCNAMSFAQWMLK